MSKVKISEVLLHLAISPIKADNEAIKRIENASGLSIKTIVEQLQHDEAKIR